MKMFEKIGSMKTSEEVHHFMYGIFCNRFKTCKLCPLSSINRPDRYYEDEDDFCCVETVLNFLNLEEDYKNEE